MNRYVKSFLHRGLIFGGFGPIICGIIFFIISAVMNISAIIFFATGNESSLGSVFLCSGSAFLCIGTAFARKDSEHKENEKAEDTTETEENTTEE
jgi:hypothetical protein